MIKQCFLWGEFLQKVLIQFLNCSSSDKILSIPQIKACSWWPHTSVRSSILLNSEELYLLEMRSHLRFMDLHCVWGFSTLFLKVWTGNTLLFKILNENRSSQSSRRDIFFIKMKKRMWFQTKKGQWIKILECRICHLKNICQRYI